MLSVHSFWHKPSSAIHLAFQGRDLTIPAFHQNKVCCIFINQYICLILLLQWHCIFDVVSLATVACMDFWSWIPWNLSFRYILFHEKSLFSDISRKCILWNMTGAVTLKSYLVNYTSCLYQKISFSMKWNVMEWQASWKSSWVPHLINKHFKLSWFQSQTLLLIGMSHIMLINR